MKRKVLFYLSILMMITTSVMIFSPVMVKAGWVLIWEGDVNSASITPVVGPTLESGEIYLIVASEIFWLDPLTDQYYVADAMYYQGTPGGTDSWNWNPALVNSAPGGQSFLQIDGASVNWGPFSNGDTGHMYTYYYTGTGAPITFFVAELLGDREAVAALNKIHSHNCLQNLVTSNKFEADYIHERRAMLELAIGRALARCGSSDGFAILISYLADNRALLAEGAHSALASISGRDYGKDTQPWRGWLEEAKDSLKPCPLGERLDG